MPKINQLTRASRIDDTDLIPKDNPSGTETEAFTAQQLADYVKGKIPAPDTTLSQSGKAADAAVTGEKITDLKNAIIGIEVTGEQSGSHIYFRNVNIPKGTKYCIELELESGSITDVAIYENSTAAENLVGYANVGAVTEFTAAHDVTLIDGYIRGASSPVFSTETLTVIGIPGLDVAVDALQFEAFGFSESKLNAGANRVTFSDLSIPSGSKIAVSAHLESGASSGIVWYYNAVDNDHVLGYSKFDTDVVFVAPTEITAITGYVQNNSSANISFQIKTVSLEYRIEQIENENDFPAYVTNAIETINSKLETLQNSESVSFPFITDIHVAGANITGRYADPTQIILGTSVKILNRIAEQNPMDFAIFNGDYLYNRETELKTDVLNWYDRLAETARGLDIPLFIGKGNHDVNDIDADGGQYLTDEELYKAFLKYATLKYHGDYGYIEKAYGYFDVPNKKIRIIFVNTVDVPFEISGGEIVYPQQHNTGISNDQLNFIANALKIDDTDWGIVFVSHHALQAGATGSSSTENYLDENMGGAQLLGVISAFRNKSSYIYNTSPYNVNVDYSGNGSSEVICMINGHTHNDATDVVDGIRMISTLESSYAYSSHGRQIGTSSETSWDIYTIDRMNRKIYTTRYGYGSDRIFDY